LHNYLLSYDTKYDKEILDTKILKEDSIIVKVDFDNFFFFNYSLESYRMKLYHKYLKTNAYLSKNIKLRKNFMIWNRQLIDELGNTSLETFYKSRFNCALIKKCFHIYNSIGLIQKIFMQDLTMINIIKYMSDLNVFHNIKLLNFFLALIKLAVPVFCNTYLYLFVTRKFQRSKTRFLMERYRGYTFFPDIYLNL